MEGEASYGKLPGKAQETRVRLLCRLKSLPSASIRVSRELRVIFPGTEGKTPLQIEILLINVKMPLTKG